MSEKDTISITDFSFKKESDAFNAKGFVFGLFEDKQSKYQIDNSKTLNLKVLINLGSDIEKVKLIKYQTMKKPSKSFSEQYLREVESARFDKETRVALEEEYRNRD